MTLNFILFWGPREGGRGDGGAVCSATILFRRSCTESGRSELTIAFFRVRVHVCVIFYLFIPACCGSCFCSFVDVTTSVFFTYDLSVALPQIKASMWMSQDFPLTLEHVTPMLEVLSMQVKAMRDLRRITAIVYLKQLRVREVSFCWSVAAEPRQPGSTTVFVVAVSFLRSSVFV